MSYHSARWQRNTLFLTFISLLLGIMIMMAINTNKAAEVKVDKDTADLITYIENMESETAALQAEIKSTRARIEEVQANQAEDQALTSAMSETLAELNARAGLMEMVGQGLVITLDDNSVGAELAQKNNPSTYNAASYIVHDRDILYLIRAIAGVAEAISVNDIRVVDSTAIRCVGTVILVNASRLAPPYEIRAIGDIEALSAALSNSGRYKYLIYSNIPVKYTSSATVTVPAYTGAYTINYSQSEE